MNDKDITEKVLLAYNDVFADIVNVLLFDGKKVILESELAEQSPGSAYKVDGKVREIERDVAKRWMKENIRIACVGIENQTDIDLDMPLRIIGYDGAEYRSQLDGKERYPVVTIVLYFGYERRWKKSTSLLERIAVPEEFAPYVNDYKINVFEIAYLEDEQVEQFHSDFRIVADYFVQMRKNRDYQPSKQQMQHVQAVLRLLSVMTGDDRFERVNQVELEGGQTMCEYLDRIIGEGIEKGIGIGKAEGKAEGRKDICALMSFLFAQNRVEDAKKASTDQVYCDQLLLEFGLK